MMENPQLMKNEREAKEVFFDKDGITISLIGIGVDEEDSDDIVIKFLIVNNSANEIRVHVGDESVNDFMVHGIMSCEVIQGKKAVAKLYLEIGMLMDIGVSSIGDIETIEFYFKILNRDTYDDLYKSDVVRIKP